MKKVAFSHHGLPFCSSRAVHVLAPYCHTLFSPVYPRKCLFLEVSLTSSPHEKLFCCILLAVICKMFMLAQNPYYDPFIGYIM